MYLNILKKDLKRKKTLNCIVLLFIVLASMFVSSSMNNIIAVFGGIDGYFDKANMPDQIVAVLGCDADAEKEILDGIDDIKSYSAEPLIGIDSSNLSILKDTSTGFVFPYGSSSMKYFGKNNDVIDGVESGKIYISTKTDGDPGDKVTLKIDGFEKEFEIAGTFKDAVFGSAMMGNERIMLSREDYDEIIQSGIENENKGMLYGIMTADGNTVDEQLSDIKVAFSAGRSMIKMTYILDMFIAAAMLIVSVLLIVTAFIVLRFTINFTLSGEFREIGVMKAIGIRNYKIRTLYIVKYFGLAVIGAIVGFAASLPFGKMMLSSVTKVMVMESSGGFLVNIICSAAVVAIIVLFCYSCTRKVSKATPLDAIRSGQTGERYRKKSVIRLGRSRLGTTGFLALNDIFSSPKRYISIVIIITLVLSPVLIMVNSSNTLNSGSIANALGVKECDAYITEVDVDKIPEYEKTMADEGMPAHISAELILKPNFVKGDKTFRSNTFYGYRNKTTDYSYLEGTAPANANEVAITTLVSESLDAHIGDTITAQFSGGEKEFIVTAIFQTMSNMGEGVRLHESFEYDKNDVVGNMGMMADFTDSPGRKEIEERIERMDDIFGCKVQNAGDFVGEVTGVGDTIQSVSLLVLVLAIIVAALVAVLMERSFIEKERGEISLRKALGFKSSTVIAHHVYRMCIAGVLGVLLAAALSIPLTNVTVAPILGMLGADSIKFTYKPLEIFLIYPAVILAAVALFTLISARYTRKITTGEIRGIE
ncbi:MAG: FtsX-like permease family protein [Alistipes sp.]|nr:FtsX-like permease family protein [Alistipes sp.]